MVHVAVWYGGLKWWWWWWYHIPKTPVTNLP
jgi:hypothetical protein